MAYYERVLVVTWVIDKGSIADLAVCVKRMFAMGYLEIW
jgi:hypothetical protein